MIVGRFLEGGGMSLQVSVSVSVVVPVYSGEAYLEELVKEFEALRSRWSGEGAPFRLGEVLLVDDAAIDGSPALIDQLAGERSWVRPIHLIRNFGQHAATIAGILHTSGDWVVTMDEDLQHPPKEIERLLRHATSREEDVVYASAHGAVHETKSRDLASRTFKQLMILLTGNKHVSHFNSFRLIRGSVARAVSSVSGHDTYFDVALSWFTTRVGFVKMDLKDRRYIETGKSGYNVAKLLSHARRMLMSSQFKMLRLGGLLGFLVTIASFLLGVFLVIQKLAFPETVNAAGWTSLALISLFFGGLITLMVGIALEYLSALGLQSNGKPIFFVVDRSSDKEISSYFDARTP
jgi:glycosyltransferase involved in cell wall biosynthesis